ncbi:hypothetical protein J6590_024826 [Homalodisca vitripennis]|nr:hypothetical protein J6590_024826 [Homalodisca vitripennis]
MENYTTSSVLMRNESLKRYGNLVKLTNKEPQHHEYFDLNELLAILLALVQPSIGSALKARHSDNNNEIYRQLKKEEMKHY